MNEPSGVAAVVFPERGSREKQKPAPRMKPVARALQHEFGVSMANAYRILDVAGFAWRDQLLREGQCRVPGLVIVRTEHLPARMRTNPRTGEPVRVAATSRLKSVIHRAIRDRVAGREARRITE